MLSKKDLFDLLNPTSLPRIIFDSLPDKIDLRDYRNLIGYIHSEPEGFEIEKYKFSSDYRIYGKQIRDTLTHIVDIAEKQGYSHNLFTALYEAVQNAHQHGNNEDENKSITLAHNITPEYLEFLISDEGGIIDKEFIPFILLHKQGLYKERFLNYYNDFGKPKTKHSENRMNMGVGTSYIHIYFDVVKYFLNEKHGLSIYLFRENPSNF